MFVFNRSVFAVLAPLALLLAVALWSNSGDVSPTRETQVAAADRGGDQHQSRHPTLTASNARDTRSQ
jgi:hypothetical protein